MIKVNPARGTPYYLVDTDGDGNLETRFNDLRGDCGFRPGFCFAGERRAFGAAGVLYSG